MPTEEDIKKAERVLEVSRYDELDIIIKKYRQMIKNIHPDKGGKDKLAGEVNAALDAIKEFKKQGIKIVSVNEGFKDKTDEVFIHPLNTNQFYKANRNKAVFEDLESILKERLNIKEENLNKANIKAKKTVEAAGGVLKSRLIKLGANLLSEYFLKGSTINFKEVVIKTLKKELKDFKIEISDDFKKGILVYFNDLFGMELTLEDLSENKKQPKSRSRKSKKDCKVNTVEGTADKLELKRLINKGRATISCSIKSAKGYYVNKRLELYYIEKIYKTDTIMVICRDSNNKIYKILAE